MNIYNTLKRVNKEAEHIAVDLGANLGLESVKIAKTFPNSKVIGVEPILENVAKMQTYFYNEGLKNQCFAEHCAIDTQKGFKKMLFELNKAMENRPNGSLEEFVWNNWEYSEANSCTVRCKTASQIEPDATLVKCDLERYEYFVLQDVIRLPKLQALFIELHGPCYELNVAEWLEKLADNRFEITWYNCNQSQSNKEDQYILTTREDCVTIPCGQWRYAVLEKLKV